MHFRPVPPEVMYPTVRQHHQVVSQPQSVASATVGAYAWLVANGLKQPSATLVLLTGDFVDIVTYYADQAGRLEYALVPIPSPFPRLANPLPIKTLVGPASVRLVAPTGTKNVAILEVKRADGRVGPHQVGRCTPSTCGWTKTRSLHLPRLYPCLPVRSPVEAPPLSLSPPPEKNLTYQWKKNGQAIAGATSSALPLENATGADAGQYVVDVNNPNGSVSSQTITVTVKMPVVPAGVYRINNSWGNPGYEVSLTSFSIDQHEVTKAFWDEVYTWAIANGHDFSNAGISAVRNIRPFHQLV